MIDGPGGSVCVIYIYPEAVRPDHLEPLAGLTRPEVVDLNRRWQPVRPRQAVRPSHSNPPLSESDPRAGHLPRPGSGHPGRARATPGPAHPRSQQQRNRLRPRRHSRRSLARRSSQCWRNATSAETDLAEATCALLWPEVAALQRRARPA